MSLTARVQGPLPISDLDQVLARTEACWEDLRGQRLFITGGTGFFGIWLLESFTRANDALGLNAQAVVLTRSPDAFGRFAPHLAAHPAIRVYEGDVCTFEFPAGDFSHVIQAAAEADPHRMRIDLLRTFSVILDGTRRVLEFSRARGVRRLLCVSSGGVYGPPPADLVGLPESYLGGPDPTDLASTYGAPSEAKRAAEALSAIYGRQYGFVASIARCFTFVGPRLPLEGKFAIGNFINDGLHRRPIEVQGDGTPVRSYLYGSDLATWLWTVLFRGAAGRAYNVGSEAAVTVRDLAQAVAAEFTPSLPVRIARPATSSRPAHRYVPVTLRARTELGLAETVSLAEAIHRTAEWYRASGSALPRESAGP